MLLVQDQGSKSIEELCLKGGQTAFESQGKLKSYVKETSQPMKLNNQKTRVVTQMKPEND